MKIAYLSTFYPLRGGIAQFNASLYRAFEKENEIKAFTFKRQYPNFLFPGETQYVTKNDKVDIINSEEILDSINPLSYYKTAKKINDFAPELLIMKYWMSFFAPSLGTVAKKMNHKTKIITVLDNVIPHEKKFYDNAFTKYFLNKNDGFVAMSEAVKEDLLSLKPRKPNVILVKHPIYNHFGKKVGQEQAKSNLKLDTNKKTILFFGFIRKYKGLDLLIEAFEKLDNSYQLVIAGECYGSFEPYQRLINQSQKKDDIHLFNRYISDDEVPNFFSAADVCILPYRSATQSGITSIALHFETPIIATDTGGLKEIVLHEKTGLIVDEVNNLTIANSIKRYFGENLKNPFIENIKELKKEMSWENFAQKITEFSKTL